MDDIDQAVFNSIQDKLIQGDTPENWAANNKLIAELNKLYEGRMELYLAGPGETTGYEFKVWGIKWLC